MRSLFCPASWCTGKQGVIRGLLMSDEVVDIPPVFRVITHKATLPPPPARLFAPEAVNTGPAKHQPWKAWMNM
ncbi:unnamed protein product [Lota lota]